MRLSVVIAMVLTGMAPLLAWAASERPANDVRPAVAAKTEDAAAAPVPVPVPSEKAMQHYRSGNVLWVVSQLVGLAIPALLLLSGLSTKMRSLAQRIGRKSFFTIGIYFLLYCLWEYVLSYPLVYYGGYVRQHAYRLSNQSFQKWQVDSLLELAVAAVFGCLLLWIPYLLIRRSPRRWWLYSGLLTIPLMVFVALVQPVWIAPLFNRFEPMKNRQLESQIFGLAQRAGIDKGRVYEVDKSVDSNAVNAYVTGVLGTKRIVLWDTLLAKLDSRQVLGVMAHEMGHYVLHHIWWGILLGSLGALAGLYATYRISQFALDRWKGRFGFDRLGDVASLPLLLLVFHTVSLVLLPIGLACSRYMEHEADRFALELTKDNHAVAMAFVRLQSENLSNPRPGLLYVLWRGSHPSLAERIEFANSYQPWAEGKPLRYGGQFQSP